MVDSVISAEAVAKIDALQKQLEEASARGRSIISIKGMDSPEFAEVERITADLGRQIKELQGKGGTHWMAQ